MDTHRSGRWTRQLRSLYAAFFALVVGTLASPAMAQTCHPKSYYVNQCQANAATKPTKPQIGNYTFSYTCEDVAPGSTTQADIMLVQTRSDNGLRSDLGHAKGPICADLCASSAPFSGWMDFTGNPPLVACKEDCAYVFGDGESGAKDEGGSEQRFVGTFVPLGRSCTASEKTASGTPAMGDPPPPTDDPGDGGDGDGDGDGSGDGDGDGDHGGDGGDDGGGDDGGGDDGGGDGDGDGDGGDGDGGDGDGGDGDGDGSDGGGGNGGDGDGSGDGGDGGDGDGDGDGGSGPAPGSSSGQPSKGSYSGDSCEAPPQCTGDAVMCGVAQESHKARCALENSLVPKEATLPDGVGEDHNQSELVGPDVDVSQGVTLDQSGFGLDSTCPFGSVEYQMGDTTASFDWSSLCDSVLGLRAFIMIMATVACWRIMRGDAKASGGLI